MRANRAERGSKTALKQPTIAINTLAKGLAAAVMLGFDSPFSLPPTKDGQKSIHTKETPCARKITTVSNGKLICIILADYLTLCGIGAELKETKFNPSRGAAPVMRALIVEDDQEFQIALTDALDHLPGAWRTYTYSRGLDAISYVKAFSGKLDLALIDLGLPDVDGVKVISEIKKHLTNTPILVVSVITCSQKLLQSFNAGASGYILKDDEVFEVAASIKQVLKGNTPISPEMAAIMIKKIANEQSSLNVTESKLSKRESQLLQCITDGLSYSKSAEVMGLKTTTIHSYSRNLFRKLGVHSQSQAAAVARKSGIFPNT